MGNWQLEVGKMVLYIFAPVGAFYAFHQANLFESAVYEKQQRTRNETTLESERMLSEINELMLKKQEENIRKEMAHLLKE